MIFAIRIPTKQLIVFLSINFSTVSSTIPLEDKVFLVLISSNRFKCVKGVAEMIPLLKCSTLLLLIKRLTL